MLPAFEGNAGDLTLPRFPNSSGTATYRNSSLAVTAKTP